MKRIIVFIIQLVAVFSFAQNQIIDQHIRIRVLAPEVFSSTEETLMALYFEPEEHWHVYWKNPGDSGAAPKFNFINSTAEFGPVLWPFPKRLPVAHLTNLGYEGAVAYPFSVRPIGIKEVRATFDLEWLVCKVECVPGFAKIQFQRPVHNKESRWKKSDQEIVRKFSSRIPSNAETAPFKIEEVKVVGEQLHVQVKSDQFEKLDLFPVNGEAISPSTPEKQMNSQKFIFKLNSAAQAPKTAQFVASIGESAWETAELATGSGAKSTDSLWSLILFSILGGFILNLMPCVFPVISIKAFSLLKTEGSERVKDCLLYSAGVITTFMLLGAGFLLFRSAGMAVGWGFQLQSPFVILGLIILFWLMALNFLGVFEIGTSTMNVAGKFSKSSSSFGTGILSVFIAAPCTGPFMGTALGAAIALPAVGALAIFAGLGLGLSLPFLLFAFFPRVLSWLPRPGAWMEWLKQFFAFPLFATVLWLIWILGQQAQILGWLLASIALLLVSFMIWLGKFVTGWKRIFIWIVTVGLLVGLGRQLKTADYNPSSAPSAWAPYSESQLKEARQKKQAVFIDFTAAWCITCQVNKQTVLDTDKAQSLFAQSEVLLMRADWTRYDPVITEALSRLGRSSVPVYAFYPSDGSEVQLLPQILTMQMIENLFPKGESK